MKDYTVILPITGYLDVQVKAESEEEAIEQAYQEGSLDELVEWEAHKKICEGNVCYALQNEIEVFED